MRDFTDLWKSSVRFRRVSRELEPLLRDVHESFGSDLHSIHGSLERLLSFLASERGRTDANCSTTYHFVTLTEDAWCDIDDATLQAILDDMSGTLHDSVHAPQIARTFEATPEQLLARIRKVRFDVPLGDTEAMMATRLEVEVKSGTAGEARRPTGTQPLALEAQPMVAPETLQERQNAVRKTRRPAGPRKQPQNDARARTESLSNAKPTIVDDPKRRS